MKNILFYFFLIFSEFVFAQNENISLSFGIQKNINDLFLQNELNFYFNKQEISIGQGVGINKSFFQQRIFPRWNFNYNINILEFRKIKFFCGLDNYYSNLEWNNSKHLFWHYIENYLIFNVEFFSRNPICLKTGIGVISEIENYNFKNYKNIIFSLSWKYYRF